MLVKHREPGVQISRRCNYRI